MKNYDELTYKVKHCSKIRTEKELSEADLFCEGYKKFLDLAKTEREAVEPVISMAKEKGYKAFDPKKKYKVGDKVYLNNRGKALILCNMGTLPISEGVHFNIAHIDSPRLDLKPNPLCEEADMAYLKTHYYGGIKKYQWTAIPLSLHGVVVKSDGTKVLDHIHEAGEKVSTRNIVNPVEEPMFLGRTAGWQLHTPSTVQWMLNAIETMEWGREYAPKK